MSEDEMVRALRRQTDLSEEQARHVVRMNSGRAYLALTEKPVRVVDARSGGKVARMDMIAKAVAMLQRQPVPTEGRRILGWSAPWPGAVLSRCDFAWNGLVLVLNIAPRTKKNGTTLGMRQRPAYRRYRKAIVGALEGPRTLYGDPILPQHEYNLRATFFVDRRGERADLTGLLQGLCDALENAGVVENDWCFRRFDGTRVVAGDPQPRVEVHISPLET